DGRLAHAGVGEQPAGADGQVINGRVVDLLVVHARPELAEAAQRHTQVQARDGGFDLEGGYRVGIAVGRGVAVEVDALAPVFRIGCDIEDEPVELRHATFSVPLS